jgi:hypothetical protein
MESVTLTHAAPSFGKASKQDAMPIVMIRDPLHWMQSIVLYYCTMLHYNILYFTGPLYLFIFDRCCWCAYGSDAGLFDFYGCTHNYHCPNQSLALTVLFLDAPLHFDVCKSI